jgi:hypothetical protein
MKKNTWIIIGILALGGATAYLLSKKPVAASSATNTADDSGTSEVLTPPIVVAPVTAPVATATTPASSEEETVAAILADPTITPAGLLNAIAVGAVSPKTAVATGIVTQAQVNAIPQSAYTTYQAGENYRYMPINGVNVPVNPGTLQPLTGLPTTQADYDAYNAEYSNSVNDENSE